MGITDFGIGPSGTPYEYNTSSWLDRATFERLDVNGTAAPFGTTSFLPADGLGVTLQQNVVLVFHDSGQTYYYWVQNVAGITPGGCPPGTAPVFSNNQWEILVGSCPSNPLAPQHNTTSYVYFVNDVYNFSASGPEGAPLYPSSIQGNGLVYGGVVYAAAAENLPGNQITLAFPSTIQLKVVSVPVGNEPEVAFEYNDGYGWQTYDVARFPFATNVTGGSSFQVNGYSYNPDGLFTDSELDLGGFGDGTYSSLANTSLSMAMYYWNGHDYQAPPNAYNFGGDTAESVDYARVASQFDPTTGDVGSSIVNATTGTALGPLYTRGQVAELQVEPSIAAGNLSYGGQNHSFVGGLYRQTIAPGTYDLTLWSSGGALIWNAGVTLAAGQFLSFAPPTYLTFVEQGLPSGSIWSVVVSGIEERARVGPSGPSAIAFTATTGKYLFDVVGPPGYAATPANGTVSVAGAPETVSVAFTLTAPATYALTFTESGLPSGATWSVVLNGVEQTGTAGSSIVFEVENGVYSYSVSGPSGYAPSPASGTVTVRGTPVTVPVMFGASSASAVGEIPLTAGAAPVVPYRGESSGLSGALGE